MMAPPCSILALPVFIVMPCMAPLLQCQAKFLAASNVKAADALDAPKRQRDANPNAAPSRLEFVRRNVAATLSALPRNAYGKLDPAIARHAVRGFFAREHGWQISGLSSIKDGATKHSGALSETAPGIVESLHSPDGIGEEDLVKTIIALEDVVASDFLQLLIVAYDAMGWTGADMLTSRGVRRLLSQYLDSVRRSSKEFYHVVSEESQSAANDAVLTYEYSARHTLNFFKHQRYSFQVVAEIATRLTHAYGRMQNDDCIAIKENLVSLDTRGVGRVSLDDFHRATPSSKYVFSESAEYLDHIGALDSNFGSIPQVRIANYILGPGNCVGRSRLYSICCLNECEAIMNEIENEVQAPWAPPDYLLTIVKNVSASSSSSSQIIASLALKLSDAAKLHDGRVNLHGRLFAQWLHFAFPHECPFPAHIDETWYRKDALIASTEERAFYVDVANSTDFTEIPSALDQWSDEEVLLSYNQDTPARMHVLQKAFGIVSQMALFSVALGGSARSFIWPALRAMYPATSVTVGEHRKEHYV